ncbi:uncharacterized protein LOC129590998 [Paramacrobiotus metropolitanus]|uniref:uncharacterized protein LOC129590998 n=1 Tax=Paramacrobiotus metropolitanus TaxID=2943436 RepID=UPI002445D722|nr:uncharacterized protein LOC129590998 [Paramacrobiotus metropolitanus]
MHLYETAERSVYAWNAVDVEMDGMLQHGHVIGLEENDSTPPRLIVDYGCQQTELVPYGQIWDCSTSSSNNVCVGGQVEVLLHAGRNGPWKWYPGKVLIRSFKHLENMALVEVSMGGQSHRELLPRQQIRKPPGKDAQQLLLAAGHFIVRTCSLPNGYWALQPSVAASLLRQTERYLNLRFVKVLSQTVLYLRQSHRSSLPGEDVLIGLVFEKKKVVREFGQKSLMNNEQTDDDCEPEPKQPSSVGEGGFTVPLDVLKEIFLSLDTIDQQRCRRTCQLWDALLTSTELCQEMRVWRQQPSPSPPTKWDRNYALYACLFKYLTPATRTICIRGSTPVRMRAYGIPKEDVEMLNLIREVIKDPALRIERFVLHQRSITMAESEFYAPKLSALSTLIVAQLAKLFSCCDRVIWKDNIITLLGRSRVPVMEFRIPVATFVLGHVDEAQIVDLLEQHLRWMGPPLDVQRILQFMADRTDNNVMAKVQKILEDYQSCDPRPSAHYRNHEWTLDTVAGVDVGQLNRVCLHALWRYVQE